MAEVNWKQTLLHLLRARTHMHGRMPCLADANVNVNSDGQIPRGCKINNHESEAHPKQERG